MQAPRAPAPPSLRALLLNRWLLSAAGVQPNSTLEVLAADHLPRAASLLQQRDPGRALWELQVVRAWNRVLITHYYKLGTG
jgi:hypothetical protein